VADFLESTLGFANSGLPRDRGRPVYFGKQPVGKWALERLLVTQSRLSLPRSFSMSRRSKQREILQALELEFRKTLVEALLAAVDDSHSQLFLAEDFNPWPEVRGRTDPKTNQLVDSANRITKLREEMGEPDESEAALFLRTCQSYCDISNANRAGVQKHAAALFDEISNLRSKRIEQIRMQIDDTFGKGP
jgi:hypothetical protein